MIGGGVSRQLFFDAYKDVDFVKEVWFKRDAVKDMYGDFHKIIRNIEYIHDEYGFVSRFTECVCIPIGYKQENFTLFLLEYSDNIKDIIEL